MTNLEFYKDKIKKMTEKQTIACAICLTKNYPNKCDDIECHLNANLIDWLCEEHKEPIKLKRWEYDFLDIIKYKEEKFKHLDFCFVLKSKKGYFKGVTDTSMTLEEILSNCIIVADDYEGFEDTK